jgi:predicted  nucleic acid-binding Zn-ribbon protein
MESEFSGHIRRVMERLAGEVEEIKRRQEAFEGMMQRVMAEQAELRRRQEAQSQAWQDFGRRWSAHFADWEVRLNGQVQQLEAFAHQLRGFVEQLAALLPPAEE